MLFFLTICEITPPLNRDIVIENLQLPPQNLIFFHFFHILFFLSSIVKFFNVSFMGVVLISQIVLCQKKTQEPVYLNMLETHFFHNIGVKVTNYHNILCKNHLTVIQTVIDNV